MYEFHDLALYLSPPVTALDSRGVPLADLRDTLAPEVVASYDQMGLDGARLAEAILSDLPVNGTSSWDPVRVLITEVPRVSQEEQMDALFDRLFSSTPLRDFQRPLPLRLRCFPGSNASEKPLEPLPFANAKASQEEEFLVSSGGWGGGGDKVWGAGRGVEDINGKNVGYYDGGMRAARARCSGAGCALIVNPRGHRTVEKFHIHSVHSAGYGTRLHKRLESKVCGSRGWKSGGLPCHGKAAFFPGSPSVFRKAMSGGSIGHASVIAWPGSCGGKGTIIELAYSCSIEHQIRGDFNPNYR